MSLIKRVYVEKRRSGKAEKRRSGKVVTGIRVNPGTGISGNRGLFK